VRQERRGSKKGNEAKDQDGKGEKGARWGGGNFHAIVDVRLGYTNASEAPAGLGSREGKRKGKTVSRRFQRKKEVALFGSKVGR